MDQAIFDQPSEFGESRRPHHRHPHDRHFHTHDSCGDMEAAVLVVGAWLVRGRVVFQFIGHAFEGKPPEFFKDWRFLFVGLSWWFAKLAGKA
jgi:uncharacterized membrane protein YGL010W